MGYRLRPFCLGHVLILQAIDSPVLKEEGEVSASDLIIALKACSSTWPFNPDLKLGLIDHLRKSMLRKSKVKLRDAVVAFELYVRSHTSRPRFWKVEASMNSMDITSPSILSLAVSLSSIGSQEEIWSMSLGKASWYDSVLLEKKGAKLRFFYDSDIEDDLPDLDELSEDELFEMAIRDLGIEKAKVWRENRIRNFNKGD